MRLQSLTLENFRQFLGSHTIEFATDPSRNVTVIYGANGAGKTTILNAFTWVLYERFTPDFEQPDRLINGYLWSQSVPGEDVTARVTLEFEHEHSRYTLERVVTERKGPDGRGQRVRDSDVTLRYTDESGSHHNQRGNPGDAIDRILPERLHQFFFFNGERIEQLVQESAFEEIEAAIKTLLGLEVIERALRHLPQVRKNLDADLRKVGTPEVARLTERIERLDTAKSDLQDQQAQERRNLAAVEDELSELDSRLRALEEARSLQEARDRAELAVQQTTGRLSNLREQIATVINERGFLAFCDELMSRTLVTFGELRTKREIPVPMKRQFVDDLLESGSCICGTSLAEGCEAHDLVVEWRRRVGLADVEEAWTRVNAQADDLRRTRESLGRDIGRLISERAAALADKVRLEEELSEIARKLERFPSEEVRDLETRRQKVLRDRDGINRRIGSIDHQLRTAEEDLAEAKRQLDKAEALSEQEKVAKRRVAVIDEAEHLFQSVLRLRTQDVREELDARVKDIYRTITFKPYRPELSEDFRLTLRAADGLLTIAKSTGENQILSLSFVGALAALARERSEDVRDAHGLLGLFTATGGIFPIVMDAPFGTLDETPRREVARSLPMLAPQVIVLASKAQGLGPAEEELRPRIGSSWVIRYLTTKDDVVVETLELPAGSQPYVDKADDGIERAELIEAR